MYIISKHATELRDVERLVDTEIEPESHVDGKHLLDIISCQFIGWIRIIDNVNAHHIAHLCNLV